MDYEKRYKEALKRAEDFYKFCDSIPEDKTMLADIFPELKREDDETIIKAMIEFFKSERVEDAATFHFGVNIESMIDWLEKKKSSAILHWKPTQSDLFVLESLASGKCNVSDYKTELTHLYNQLLKLSELLEK